MKKNFIDTVKYLTIVVITFGISIKLYIYLMYMILQDLFNISIDAKLHLLLSLIGIIIFCPLALKLGDFVVYRNKEKEEE